MNLMHKMFECEKVAEIVLKDYALVQLNEIENAFLKNEKDACVL